MTDILFRPALPDELPAIIGLLQDDVLGQRREAEVSDPVYRGAAPGAARSKPSASPAPSAAPASARA